MAGNEIANAFGNKSAIEISIQRLYKTFYEQDGRILNINQILKNTVNLIPCTSTTLAITLMKIKESFLTAFK